MRYVIGIDAGGTKTVALLADESGRVLAEARAGGANLQVHDELEVEKVFDQVIESVSGGRSVAALCLGIAGVCRQGQILGTNTKNDLSPDSHRLHLLSHVPGQGDLDTAVRQDLPETTLPSATLKYSRSTVDGRRAWRTNRQMTGRATG